MSRERYDHDHIYRAVSSNLKMYRCVRQGCVHSINAVSMLGRKAMCPACETTLIIDEDNLRRRNITHVGCGGKVGSAKHMKPNPDVLKGVDIKNLFDRIKQTAPSSSSTE